MGFEDNPQTDALIEFYYEYTKKVKECDIIKDSTQLNGLAEDVFEKLGYIKND